MCPYYPADIDDYALKYFGPSRYHSNEFQQEAYLFIPFDEKYYQTMAQVIEERFENWQGQDFDEDTLEPSEVAQAIMEYLDCECTYFPSMADDDPIMSAYSYAQRLGVREGFVPVLIKADDETLLECLVMNADPENDADFYYTDKPDWDAFGAMLLVAACHTYEEPVPLTVEKDWDFGEHPLIARLASDEERVWSLLRGATWWLPLTDSFLFQGPLPTDDQTMIATLGGLRKELEKLNQLAWQADEDTILGWADTEGYPVDGTVDSDGQYSKADIPEHTQYDTQSLAKFAFSMFWRAMRFAEEQQVPILLDY